MTNNANKLRMVQWLIISIALYALAFGIDAMGGRQLSTIAWKVGHLTVAANVGYWIDRVTFKHSRIDANATDLRRICRAMIIVGAMLSVAMGM